MFESSLACCSKADRFKAAVEFVLLIDGGHMIANGSDQSQMIQCRRTQIHGKPVRDPPKTESVMSQSAVTRIPKVRQPPVLLAQPSAVPILVTAEPAPA